MRTDACVATRVRAEQSEEMLDLRMECLDARLGEVRAQVQALEHAGSGAVGKAAQAAGSLTPLGGCADAALLRAPIRPPADAAARERVFGLAILGFALTEAVALYALVIAFIILFV